MDFDTGLCGIGYGIDYLIQNEFVKAESDFLEEIDRSVVMDTERGRTGVKQYVSAAKYWLQRGNSKQFALNMDKIASYLIERVGDAREVPHDDYITFPLFVNLALFHIGNKIAPGHDVRKLYNLLAGTKDKDYIQWLLGQNFRVIAKQIDHLFCTDMSEPGSRFFSGDLWPDDITLSNLLCFRDNYLQCKISYPEGITLSKVRRILADEDILDEWVDLALPQTMNIGGYMTGFGWVLLDMFDQQLLKL
jgi:hypothetical protein